MEYLTISKIKKVSDSNYQWGVWNIEANDSMKYGREYNFIDNDTYAPVHHFYSDLAVVNAINKYVDETEGFKYLLIRDIFNRRLVWVS